MKQLAEFGAYSHSDGRLVSPENHVSFVLPEDVHGEAELDQLSLKCDGLEKFCGYLSLHKSSDLSTSSWVAEPWESGGERLGWQADIGPLREHPAARFRSLHYVGFKVVANDMFGNGLSAGFRAGLSCADALLEILKQLIDSLQFVHWSFDQEQLKQCFSAYMQLPPSSMLLYIDQHRFLMRDDVLKFFERIVKFAETDGDAMAQQMRENFELLRTSRETFDTDKAAFEDVMAHYEDKNRDPE